MPRCLASKVLVSVPRSGSSYRRGSNQKACLKCQEVQRDTRSHRSMERGMINGCTVNLARCGQANPSTYCDWSCSDPDRYDYFFCTCSCLMSFRTTSECPLGSETMYRLAMTPFGSIRNVSRLAKPVKFMTP